MIDLLCDFSFLLTILVLVNWYGIYLNLYHYFKLRRLFLFLLFGFLIIGGIVFFTSNLTVLLFCALFMSFAILLIVLGCRSNRSFIKWIGAFKKGNSR